MSKKALNAGYGEIKQGIYIGNFNDSNFYNLEIYKVHEENNQFIATDIEGKSFLLEDPGYYDRKRRNVHEGSIDSITLFPINIRPALKEDLVKTQQKISKLLQMLEDNKANLSQRNICNQMAEDKLLFQKDHKPRKLL